MKKKIKVYSIGVLVCIIFDVAFATLVVLKEPPFSDYILMGIFLLISDSWTEPYLLKGRIRK